MTRLRLLLAVVLLLASCGPGVPPTATPDTGATEAALLSKLVATLTAEAAAQSPPTAQTMATVTTQSLGHTPYPGSTGTPVPAPSPITLNAEGASKQDLIEALEDLRKAMLTKLDRDVGRTARVFTGVRD